MIFLQCVTNAPPCMLGALLILKLNLYATTLTTQKIIFNTVETGKAKR